MTAAQAFTGEVTEARESFRSGGREIAVEWFGAGGRRPCILMLHGAEGLQSGGRYREGARLIAQAGRHVALVHYLDRTGERRVNYATLMQNFPSWLGTVGDAVGWAAGRHDVIADGVGVVGVSLGGLLGIATAHQDRRVRALVTYFAPLPQMVADAAGPLPPTLVLHGDRDPIVPVANARTLEAILRRQGAPHEVVVYAGEGHGFGQRTQEDADRRVAAFLDRHLPG
jgi:carboxymethylenebutenolidase